jgi:hypothetical protein
MTMARRKPLRKKRKETKRRDPLEPLGEISGALIISIPTISIPIMDP